MDNTPNHITRELAMRLAIQAWPLARADGTNLINLASSIERWLTTGDVNAAELVMVDTSLVSESPP